ncbi:MAG: hypothetical protein AAGL66_03265 [Pseudomonadota bacterium]
MHCTQLPVTRCFQRRFPLASAMLAITVLGSAGVAESATCEADSCNGSHSSLFAIAHDHNDYADTILYRVTLPEQATGTAFGDGTNGFFYRTSYDGGNTYASIVPFNGIGLTAEGAPSLRPFSFIVKLPKTATEFSLQACASDYAEDTSGAAECSKILWTDDYAALPTPTVGASPLPNSLSLEYLNSTVSVRNNGVFGTRVLLKASEPLTEAQIDWLYDHLVFLDGSNNVYSNDVLADSTESPSFAALTIEQAAQPTEPGGDAYITKYGQVTQPVTPNDPSQTANRYYWVYSTNVSNVDGGQSIPISVGWLYDVSANCLGALSGYANSRDPNCSVPASEGALGGSNAILELSVLSGSDVTVQGQSENAAGTRFVRTVDLLMSDSHSLCTAPVNPLAVYGQDAVNLPNYVINRTTASGTAWQKQFPPALYYVLPTGFGNCDGAQAPFCDLSSNYTAYTPAYLDQNGLGGSLNGNSTSAPLLGTTNGTFKVLDQYKLDNLATVGTNTLVWFDNCGYGHLYQDDALSGRLTVPPSNKPSQFPLFVYSLSNSLDEPVVFAKECCASLYQENTNNCTQQQDGTLTECAYNPPQQIGKSVNAGEYSGSGIYVGPGETVKYTTMFSDEVVQTYNAVSGAELFKMRLMAARSSVTDAGDPVVYDCDDPNARVALTGTGSNWTVDIGSTATTAMTCKPGKAQGACPWPLLAGTGTGAWSGYTFCSLTSAQDSSLLLDVANWAKQTLAPSQTVTLMAWGANGQSGHSNGSRHGGAGGAEGFASTVLTGADLQAIPAFYAYLAAQAGSTSQGASSTILAKRPLSSVSAQDLTNGEPEDNVLLIAGGGAGGGDGAKDFGSVFQGGAGGRGGYACANADTLPSSAVSVAGAGGARSCHPPGDGGCSEEAKCTGGTGGNSQGDGNAGSGGSGGANGTAGIGGYSSGTGWRQWGSLVGTTINTGRGGGNQNYGGAGGGGYGGGGGSESCSGSGGGGAGGGGGGSFAAANTAYEPLAPQPSACKPPWGGSATTGTVQLFYAGTALAFPGKLSTEAHPELGECLNATAAYGDIITSSTGWQLRWRSNGALAVMVGNSEVKWTTEAYGNAAELCFQNTDGNLVINEGGSTPWATGVGGARLAFDGECNVVLLNASNEAIWSTGTSCG